MPFTGFLQLAWAWADPRQRRAGRRGLFLCFLVILDASYGYSLIAASGPPGGRLYPLISQYAWGITWLCAAGVCASGILAWRDRWQYAVAATLKMAWAARYADLWFFGKAPLAWVGVAVWASFALTVLVVSDWPEASPPPIVPHLPDLPEAGE